LFFLGALIQRQDGFCVVLAPVLQQARGFGHVRVVLKRLGGFCFIVISLGVVLAIARVEEEQLADGRDKERVGGQDFLVGLFRFLGLALLLLNQAAGHQGWSVAGVGLQHLLDTGGGLG